MQFTSETGTNGVVMALQGAFTFNDHLSFRLLLDTLKASPGHRHVLDLSQVDFLDSAALGMLLIAEDEAKAAGWSLALRKPSSQISSLIEIAALDTIFTIEP